MKSVSEVFASLEEASRAWERPYVGAPYMARVLGTGMVFACAQGRATLGYTYGYWDLGRRPTEDEEGAAVMWIQGKLFGWDTVNWHGFKPPEPLPPSLWTPKLVSPWKWRK